MKVILIYSMVLVLSLGAKEIDFKPVITLLKSTDKKSYEKALEIQSIVKKASSISGDIVYCLISDSIELGYLKSVVLEVTALGAQTDTKLAFITQGIYSKKFLEKITKLHEELSSYDHSEEFKKNINLFISPSLYDEHNITKVPALMYAKYRGGIYPKKESIEYISRGETSPFDFFKLISTKESRFEKYSEIISTLY
jgi:hypothetical protein